MENWISNKSSYSMKKDKGAFAVWMLRNAEEMYKERKLGNFPSSDIIGRRGNSLQFPVPLPFSLTPTQKLLLLPTMSPSAVPTYLRGMFSFTQNLMKEKGLLHTSLSP